MRSGPAYVIIGSEATGSILCHRGEVAADFASRLTGLLGRRGFEATDGLLIQPSSGVHTVGMKFSIDVLALDADRRVVALKQNLKPQRVALLLTGAKEVLELPAGRIEQAAIAIGDRLFVVPSSDYQG
jgi:uncharacterized membrane protein (UPF0127 family)